MKNGISSKEGDNVTLRCIYKTAGSDVFLFWYKHQSEHLAPQFILWKGAKALSSEFIPDKRYSSKTGQGVSELTITAVRLADSAVYYCASTHNDTKRKRACTKT